MGRRFESYPGSLEVDYYNYMDEKNRNAVEIYDLIAEEYSKNFDGIGSEDDLVFINVLLGHLEPNAYIVDLGCGTGFSSGYFSQKGMRVEGSDLSSRMIAIAQRNYPTIKFTVADMREFSPSQTADAVWAGYSLFHFEQVEFEKTLEKIKTYLKPGGFFGLVIQEGAGEMEVPEPFLPERKIYLHLYTEEQLKTILEKHGFKIVDQKRKEPMHPNEFPYNKLLLVAEFG